MRKLMILAYLWLAPVESGHSQNNQPDELYGSKGLRITKEILAKLNLPEWYWGGAHVYENIQRNYRIVDGELLEKYFSKFPSKGLNDPQNFLDEEQRETLETLIAAHDTKSSLPLYVNILAHGQQLSLSEDEIETKLSQMLKGKNALIIFYHYGHAQGVNGYVLLDGEGFIKNWEVDELFLKSAKDANLQADKFAETESFIKEFSKRSYWIEQKLITPVATQKNDEELNQETQKNSNQLDEWLQILANHTSTLALALGILVAGGWYYIWSRKWRKYVLPIRDVPVRLGADHGANVSNPIEFSDPKFSLTDQYKKTKNREL